MNIDLSRFRDSFFEDAEEHIESMEAGLLRIEDSVDGGVPDPEDLHAVFRDAHSIKGAAGSLGFEPITRLTHALESVLDRLRDGRLAATRPRTALLLRAVDALRTLLGAMRRGDPEPAELAEQVAELAQDAAACGGAPGVSPAARQPERSAQPELFEIRFAAAPNLFQCGMDPLLILRELSGLGMLEQVRLEANRIPDLHALDPERCDLAWTLRLRTVASRAEIEEVFLFVEDGSDIDILAPRPASTASRAAPSGRSPAASQGASIRVSTEKVDKLIDLVGELVIAQSMAAQAIQDFDAAKLLLLGQALGQTQRYTRELQEQIMGVRMLPVGSVFSRFPRMLRDVAEQLDKKIGLEISGEETELDKGVVEGIVDPLTHLLRNAADHGIELPEQRRAAGKPEQGRIALRAFHRSGAVVIEVEDDGAGLDAERIREKAVERGLIQPDEVLDEARIYDLVMQPGFSTKSRSSDLSGRGVGMDVVRRNVEQLNGSVSLQSRPGAGVKATVTLPLTLAIVDGLSLKVGGQTFVLPLVSIVESLRPARGSVRRPAGEREIVLVRGETLPLLRLHELFSIDGAQQDPSRALAVIVEHDGRRMALLVDELLGHLQVVIKSLEQNYRRVEGALGATILGDGRAALILDVSGLTQLASASQRRRDTHIATDGEPVALAAS